MRSRLEFSRASGLNGAPQPRGKVSKNAGLYKYDWCAACARLAADHYAGGDCCSGAVGGNRSGDGSAILTTAMKDELMAALRERAPVNRQIIEQVAEEMLPGRSFLDFKKWLETYETYLIRLING